MLTCYFVYLDRYSTPDHAGSDDSALLLSYKLLLETRLSIQVELLADILE